MAFGILRKQAAGGFQRSMISNAGEDIEDLALVRRGIADAVGGQQRQTKAFRKRDRLLIDRFFFAIVVPLQFDVDIVRGRRCSISRSSVRAAIVFQEWLESSGPHSPPVRQIRPRAYAASSSSVIAPSPLGARSFMRVISRQRF